MKKKQDKRYYGDDNNYQQQNKNTNMISKGFVARPMVLLVSVVLLILTAVAAAATIVILLQQQQIMMLLASTETFRAGAYEQKVMSAYNATTREEALVIMRANLANMDKQARIASKEGVNVMVFAEYGITGDMGDERSSVYPYMEKIPDASKSQPVCTGCKDITPSGEGQISIACIASKYQMYVVANLIECVPCQTGLDSSCPSDGHYQYNTNIVYDPKGCLIGKYHKYHRYEVEFSIIDKPSEPEYVYFDTAYGRFGTVICADLLYKYPAIALTEQYDIDHLLFPTNWNGNGLPYGSAVEWQIAYATLTNVNFIGAGVHSMSGMEFGSSILNGKTIVNFTSNYTSNIGRLIVGDLPTSKPTSTLQTSLKHERVQYSSSKSTTKTAEIFGDLYDVAVLDGLTGNIRVCQTSLCCSLDYRRNSTDETYILGAFKGVHTFLEKLGVELCLLYKCANSSLSSCSNLEVISTTSFSHIVLSGNFTVEYVYPALLPSQFAFDQLNWSFNRTVSDIRDTIMSSGTYPLVAAAVVGRDFKLDSSV